MASCELSVDEIVEALARSRLPTVLVEGKTDMRIYRWLERRLGRGCVDFQPCGNKDKVRQVWERRNEYRNIPAVALVDRDVWTYTGLPSDVGTVLITTGYCIENDIYAGSDVESLLDPDEADKHRRLLDVLIQWYAFEVENIRAGLEFEINVHLSRVVKPGKYELDATFQRRRAVKEASGEVVRELRENYRLMLHGKVLFQALERYLSATKRRVKHSYDSLLENAVKSSFPNRYRDALLSGIRKGLDAAQEIGA